MMSVTELLSRAKQAIESGETSLRAAAEDIAAAEEQGANIPGRYANDEGENDRSLITSDTKPDRSNQSPVKNSEAIELWP